MAWDIVVMTFSSRRLFWGSFECLLRLVSREIPQSEGVKPVISYLFHDWITERSTCFEPPRPDQSISDILYDDDLFVRRVTVFLMCASARLSVSSSYSSLARHFRGEYLGAMEWIRLSSLRNLAGQNMASGHAKAIGWNVSYSHVLRGPTPPAPRTVHNPALLAQVAGSRGVRQNSIWVAKPPPSPSSDSVLISDCNCVIRCSTLAPWATDGDQKKAVQEMKQNKFQEAKI